MNAFHNSAFLVVSRHPAAIDFIAEYLGASIGDDRSYMIVTADPDSANETFSIPIVANATPADVKDKHVFGVVPLNLAVHAYCVHVIEFETPPRGLEYTLEDMKAAGARIANYKVQPFAEFAEGEIERANLGAS